ncbi:MAG: Smr/MutS family protein [Sphingopyxis sp.]
MASAANRAAPPPPDDGGSGLWQRVTATVRPLPRPMPRTVPRPAVGAMMAADGSDAAGNAGAGNARAVRGRVPAPPPPMPRAAPPAKPIGSAPIDKGWERQLSSGRQPPDMVIDLHGHHLAGAHTALSRALDRAVAQGARLVLVIAGKQRGPDEAPRGAIRRELATWLAHSHHHGRILAVRNAHPRHGGAGAVYLLLRKS